MNRSEQWDMYRNIRNKGEIELWEIMKSTNGMKGKNEKIEKSEKITTCIILYC